MNQNQNHNAGSYDAMLKQASQKSKSVYNIKKIYPAIIALISGLILSALAFKFVGDFTSQSLKNDFDKATSSAMTRFENAEKSNTGTLTSFKTLYNDRVAVVRDVFELYASVPAKTYNYLLLVSWSSFIEPKDLSDHIYSVRSQGYFDYAIHPDGARDKYLPVDYLMPFNGEKSGLDLYSMPEYKSAADRAFTSGEIASTASFNSRKDTLCFFLMQPIYRKGIDLNSPTSRKSGALGLISLEIETNKFFKTALGNGVASDATIIFEILDDNQKIFNSQNANLLASGFKPYLKEDKALKIGDRELKVKFYTTPDFGGTLQGSASYFALFFGILISIALSAFIFQVLTGRARAVDLAERMTRSQRRIVDSSSDIIAVMDMQGIWKSMNPASEQIFGTSPDILLGRNISDLIATPHDSHKLSSAIEKAKDESTEKIDLLMKSSDAEKWISWNLTISHTDGLIYAIGRDVTAEKLAEEQAKLRSRQVKIAEQFALEASESKSYFMTKLSHQLRNALTGIMGYLELLANRLYDNDEEYDSFVMLANESSEELFTTVTDIIDVAIGSEGARYVEPKVVELKNVVSESLKEINKLSNEDGTKRDITITFDEGEDAKVIADFDSIVQALNLISLSLTESMDKADIKIVAQENRYEGATDIQILSPANPLTHQMINIYKANNTDIIPALEKDKNDILYRFTRAASIIRRLNGSLTIESFGENDENLVVIALPLNRTSIG